MLRGLDEAEAAFHRMDTNCDGVLSPMEFRKGIHAAGFKVSRQQINELIRKFDKEGKGHISMADFRREFAAHFPKAPGAGASGAAARRAALKHSRKRAKNTDVDVSIDSKVKASIHRWVSSSIPFVRIFTDTVLHCHTIQ